MALLIARLAGLLLLLIPTLGDAQTPGSDSKPRDPSEEISSMHWMEAPATIKLPLSHSSVALPGGYSMVSGADAQRLEFLSNAVHDDSIEGVIVRVNNLNSVVFNYFNEGYVSSDDWNDIDSKTMLQEVKDNTEKANADRRQQNIEELHVTGWIQEPTFDRNTQTVYWAIGASTPSGRIVNSIALRLSRNGYEKLTWVSTPTDNQISENDLAVALRAHAFASGTAYADHVSTDKIASYGIASLVAVAAGAKLLKVAGAGALLIIIKKFGLIIVAGGVALLASIRRFFTRKSKGQG